jgi:hypothetical protein
LNTTGIQKIQCPSCLKKPDSREMFSEAGMFITTHLVHLQDEEYQVEDIRGFVTCEYDKVVACVHVTSE